MIEVKVVLSPQGNVWNQEVIGQLYIVNDGTGNSVYGNYKYVLSDNYELKKSGYVKNFPRHEGVWELIREIL